MKKKNILHIFIRYSILVLFGIFLPFFYKIFSLLTTWPIYFLLSIFYNVSFTENALQVLGARIEIIDACVAGSAYYLLLILNLTTNMEAKQRLYSLIFSVFSLFIFNLLRIFSLSILYIENFAFFDFTHKLFWYILSTIFVVGIWFLTVKIFKIDEIPIYSDIKSLYKSRR